MPDTQVVRLLAAAKELAEITQAQEAIAIIRLAEAARVYARQAELGAEAENAATAIRLKAEIRLAEIVDEGQKRGEIAVSGNHLPRSEVRTYRDLGLSAQNVHRARQVAAAFTPTEIDAMAEVATARGESISRTSLLREANRQAIGAEEEALDAVTPGADAINRDRDIAHLRSLVHELIPLAERVGPYLSPDQRRTLVGQLITVRRLIGGMDRMEVIDGHAG